MFILKPIARTINADNAFCFGGRNGAALNTIQRLTGTVMSTDSATAGGTGDTQFTCAASINSLGYFFGGESGGGSATQTCRKYDGLTRTSVGNMASAVSQSSSSTIGALAYIFGGYTSTGNLTGTNTINIHDGSTGAIDGFTLSTSNYGSSAASLSNNALIFGGGSLSTYYSHIDRHDGSARTTESTSLSAGLRQSAASTLGSNIFIIGGRISSGAVAAIQKYNGSVFLTGSTMSSGLHSCAVTTVGTNIIIFGGFNTTSGSSVSSVQVFDGTTTTVLSTTLASINHGASAATITSSQNL